jgi:hypothetical protein
VTSEATAEGVRTADAKMRRTNAPALRGDVTNKPKLVRHRLRGARRRNEASNRAWFNSGRFRVTRGFLIAGRDRSCVVAGLCEAGHSRYTGVTDPGYNWRCYLALNHASNRTGYRSQVAGGKQDQSMKLFCETNPLRPARSRRTNPRLVSCPLSVLSCPSPAAKPKVLRRRSLRTNPPTPAKT